MSEVRRRKIVLVTYGSLGDLHPALALALGLQARGHAAVIATSEPYRAKVTALSLGFAAVRPDLSLSDAHLVRRVMDGQRGSEFLMRKLVYPAIRDMHADLAPLAANADLLLAGELACAVPIVAEQQRKPWAYVALSPVMFYPTIDYSVLPGPAILHAVQRLGPAANRFVLRMARLVSHPWWRPVRRFRRELGLGPASSPLFEGKYSPYLNLALFSATLQPPQPEWPPHTLQAGFCFLDEPTGTGPSRLPPPVEGFLEAGDPPIVFTLGSAAVHLARDFYAESAAAARLLGRRAVLLLGPNSPPPDLPPSILGCDYLPHGAIFPRASAIVHQGGVGTTAQAMRAGRPMLVLPFAHDQFDNAARVCRHGIARQIGRRQYRAARAAAELTPLLSDCGYRHRAESIAAQIRSENGVARACDAIEDLLQLPRSSAANR